MSEAASTSSDRVRAALAMLVRRGLDGCTARAAGSEGEVLLLAAPAADENRLRDAADPIFLAELRGVGFRYIALDLASGEPST